MPDGLLQAIKEKRQAIQSAEYTVQSLLQSTNNTRTNSARFHFQGKNQWFADISEFMQSSVFQTGCDGKTEWGFFNNRGEVHYKMRKLEDIKDVSLSFLDPFLFLDDLEESLEARTQRRGIRYFGVEEVVGIKRHIFGRENRQSDARRSSTTRIEIAINTETLLPETVRTHTDSTMFVGERTMETSLQTTLSFDFVSKNEKLPDTAFLPEKTEGAEPVLQAKPDEGYDTFFVRINDGAGGRMSIRTNGQRGQKGTSSSGLN